MSQLNPYDILGVQSTASKEEIKKAYRKLSLKHHPDRGGDSEKFKELSSAYDQITNPDKNPSGPTINPNVPMNMDDLIKSMFGMNNVFPPGVETSFNFQHIHKQFQKPPPILLNITISIEQAYSGCAMPLEIERWVLNDNVKETEKETLYVNIPQGIDSNELIVFREKGNIANDKLKGDVKIFIKVNNTSVFKRSGLNLIYERDITLKESLCGFSFDLEHINGKKFRINNGDGSVVGVNYQKVCQGLGMKRGEHCGNLIIIFNIKFPTKISLQQVAQLKNIL
jgi:DnaJ-class molecular chaperone